nr:hypothetical protein [Tanacetum cinerariifolium]
MTQRGRLQDSTCTKIHQRVQGSNKKKAINEEMVSLEKNQTYSLVRLLAENKAPQSLWMFRVKEEQNNSERDVHQVSNEREVEVMRIFKWPPSELITEDGVLPERLYSQFNDVASCMVGREARCSTRFEGRIVGCKPNPTSVE